MFEKKFLFFLKEVGAKWREERNEIVEGSIATFFSPQIIEFD
jgi:hypothetical protein